MANAHQSEPSYKVVVEKDQVMRTRDGVCLRADVYRPDAPGRFPVLLVRTPYDKGAGMALTEKDYFPPRGYVVVVQDTRGRHSSEGDFYPFVHEACDGYDAVEWAAALPWSDGKVGMVGQSYLGLVQYYAASLRPPHLSDAARSQGRSATSRISLTGAARSNWDGCSAYFMFMARDTLTRKGIYDQRARAAGQLSFASGHPDGPAQARRLSASADGRLGRAAEGWRAVSCRLSPPLDGRSVLGRDRSAPAIRRSRHADASRRIVVRRLPIRHARRCTSGCATARSEPGAARAEVADGPVGASAALLDPDFAAAPGISISAPRRQSNCTPSNSDGSIISKGRRQRRARGAASAPVRDGRESLARRKRMAARPHAIYRNVSA